MVPFRGRLKFRQCIKGKRHKLGKTHFKLGLPGGYTYHTKICSADKTKGMSVAIKVVFDVLGRTLFTDNWYTSIQLTKALQAHKTHLVGTIRKKQEGNIEGNSINKIKKKQTMY